MAISTIPMATTTNTPPGVESRPAVSEVVEPDELDDPPAANVPAVTARAR